MAITAEQFQDLADKFMTKTFVDLVKPMTMRLADAPVYGTPQTWTSEVGTAVERSIDSSKFDGELIRVGDFSLTTNASQWTTDPRTDNVEIIFDGKTCQVVTVEKDAANAAYLITVREK